MDINKDLNDAIDKSKDHDELTDNLVRLHKTYYGNDVTNSLIDDFVSDKKMLREVISDDIRNFNMKGANKEVASEIYKGTPESEYLQPIYDYADPLLKGVSLLEKPISTAIATGRSIGKIANAGINALNPDYGVPLEGNLPLYDELYSDEDGIQWFPTPAGSFTADIRENYPEISSGFLKDQLPENFKGQYPKLSSAIENFGPMDIADIGAGFAAPSALKAGAAGSKLASEAGSLENVKKAIIRMSNETSAVNKARLNKNLDRIATRIIDDPELLKRLGNPKEMEKYLLGEGVGFRTKFGSKTQATKSLGAIHDAGAELKNAIKKYSNITFDNPQQIKNLIVKRISDRVGDLGSGADFNINQIIDEVENFTNASKRSNYSFEDIVRMKRNVSKKLFDLGKSSYDPSSISSLKNMVAEELWSHLDRTIKKTAKKLNDPSITDANAKFNDLASIRDFMGTKVTTELGVPSLKESVVGGSALATGAMAVGMSPWQAALLGGVYPVGRAVEKGMASKYPSYAARASKIAQKGYGVMSKVPTAPLALSLASYEIPRNTKRIQEEADLVLAKIAQESNTPEGQVMFDVIHDAIKNNPQKLPKLMEILSQQSPHIFQFSKYGGYDNIIPEANRKAALKELNNSSSLSNGEKAAKIKRLITEGYYEEQ